MLHCHGCDSEVAGDRGGGVGGTACSANSLVNNTFNTFITPPSQESLLSSSGGGDGEGGEGCALCERGNDFKAARESRVGEVRVVCPGKLSSGCFCVLTLRRHDPDRSWHMSEREFLHLYS